MKAVISGMNGFIGKHLARSLMAKEIDVLPIDRKLLINPKKLWEFIKWENPDYIFCLHAYGNHSSQQNDEETFLANVAATFNLLNASKDIPYKAFINFGSSSEYGKKQTAMKEEDLPEAETMYGCTKVAGTYLARAFSKKYDLPIVTVRPFSVYGPGEADFRFIPTVIRCALRGEELKLEPTGMHDWIYIWDFIEGVLQVADHAKTLQGQAINIGTGAQSSNKEIVEEISFLSDKFIKTDTKYMRPNDSGVWIGKSDTLKLLGWKPQYDLESGLLETYRYYANHEKHN